MADVSHELGALRFVVDSPLSSKVAMFNNQANQAQQANMLNPFSSANSGRASPKPTFSKDEYGKPLAGSVTEMRGQKANMHVLREMLELCQIIDSEGYKVNDEPTMRVIPFGELFNIYNYISDKVVGILLRARKYNYVQFEGEMLFQRRDDHVPVFLLRPIQDIRRDIESKIECIKRAASPAPIATTLLQDKGAHQQKLQEAALNVPGGKGSPRNSKSRSPSPAPTKKGSKAPSPAPEVTVTSAPAESIATVETPTNIIAENVAPTATEIEASITATEEPVAVNKTEDITSTEAAVDTAVSNAADLTAEAAVISNTENVASEPEKTDQNNNNNSNINVDDLPTIVIEATAIYEYSEDGSAEPITVEVDGTLENVAAKTDSPVQ